MKTTNEIRKQFLDYFAKQKHTIVPSSSLIPMNDPTLLFVNAGMVQFKDVFLGVDKRDYTRATSSQRCVRAGGKHNDLENVGYTARHHTFFEMLGNFSFGDYFKKEAIDFAWNFLTKELGIPKEKLWVTVYKDDKEAEAIWLNELKIDPSRFSRCGEKDNFWSMGDTGPCGPCTEIFYDHGADIPGGPPGSPDEDGDRYIEIWNLVFMQYERQANGELKPLPKPSVDTGMGLERVAAVLQGVHTNYQIDMFQGIVKAIYEELGQTPSKKDLMHPDASFNVVADHIRSCSFLIVDGVVPSNEGRGYVLRRIIRRAIRHGNKLGFTKAFFNKLVAPLVKEMGDAYPDLKKQQTKIEDVLLKEEEQFAETLEHGLKLFKQAIEKLKEKVIPGDVVFKLYDTYGFPADLTADLAREMDLTIDQAGFDRCMGEQRSRSQAASQFGLDYTKLVNLDDETEFFGYQSLATEGKVVAIFKGDQQVDVLEEGEEGAIVLDKTSFYAESGGQIGDHGEIVNGRTQFTVSDTKKAGGAFIHLGLLESGSIKVGDKLESRVNQTSRQSTALNHSATHLLHAALKEVLGDQVQQKGSLVAPDRLRFDFSHAKAVTHEELQHVEQLVNQEIRANHEVETNVMSADQAKDSGAVALFGEKYGDEVRVLSMGGFSKELCGGTHVKRTGDIGFFTILSEGGIASGVRRIDAVTGNAAVEEAQSLDNTLANVSKLMKTNDKDLESKLKQLISNQKHLEKELQQFQSKLAAKAGSDLASQAIEIEGLQLLALEVKNADMKALREMMDQLKSQLPSGVIVLATVVGGNKIQLNAGVSKDALGKIHAGKLVGFVAEQVGGKGGGRPDMAQAGGSDVAKLDEALKSVEAWVKKQM
jgi:alanyl-tRNA synthetase